MYKVKFGVSLASTTFFSILLAALTWIMPGVNAILIPYRRPDLFLLTNNMGKFLGRPRLVWYGSLWLVFIILVQPRRNKSEGCDRLEGRRSRRRRKRSCLNHARPPCRSVQCSKTFCTA